MRTGFLVFTLLVLSSLSVHAAPFDNIITHNDAVPEQSFQIAKLWFLPDYQASLTNRSDTAPDKSGDRHDLTCSTYGYVNSCSWPYISTGKVFPLQKLHCQRSCVCDPSFQYNLANSPADRWILGAETCDGKSNNRTAKPCPPNYTLNLQNCSAQTHPEGWTYTNQYDNKPAYSGNQVCGLCSPVSCEGAYTANLNDCNQKTHPEGWAYSSSGYAGNEICGLCSELKCTTGFDPGVEECTDTQGWSYSSKGYSGDKICGKCTQNLCDEANGYSAGLTSCQNKTNPDAVYWTYSTKGYSGTKVCGKCSEMNCEEKNNLCPAGTLNLDYYFSNGALRCFIK